MRARLLPVLLCLTLSAPATLGGCVSVSRQHEGATLPAEKLSGVEVGETTRQQVLEAFGPPMDVLRRDIEGLVRGLGTRFRGQELTVKIDPTLFNEVFLYEYRRVNRIAVVLVLFNYFSSVDKSDRLMFFFDADGTLGGYGLTEGTKEL